MSSNVGANSELRRSFAWRVFAAAGGMGSTVLLSVIIVRSLDLQQAAVFFAILASVSFGPLIGRLGLGYNVIRLMGAEADPKARRQIAGIHLHATALLTMVSAPLIALIGCNALIGHSGFVPVFVLTTVLIALESIRLMISDIFAAAGRVRASAATMHYVRSLVTLPLVALVVLIHSRPTLVEVVGTYLAVSAVQFVFALIHARHEVAIFEIPSGMAVLRTAIGQGTRLFSLDLSEFMLRQGTIWLATAAFSPLAATHYAAAATLAAQVILLDSLCALAVTPPAARLWAAGERSRVLRMLSNAATLNTVVAVSVVVFLAVLGPFVLETAYGPDMRSSSTILLILAASGIFQACFDGSVTLLVISGHVAAASRTAISVLAVAVPSAVIAALLGGPVALAVVASLSIVAKSVGQALTARRTFGATPHAHLRVITAVRELMSDRETDRDMRGSPFDVSIRVAQPT